MYNIYQFEKKLSIDAHRKKQELKSIADTGLVGYPNAGEYYCYHRHYYHNYYHHYTHHYTHNHHYSNTGKSSLLRVLSNAKPEVASYPFTTLHPSIGVIEYSDTLRLRMADIPGT